MGSSVKQRREEMREYIKLAKLVDLDKDEEGYAKWLENLTVSEVLDGYNFADDDEVVTFRDDEVESVDVRCYNFMAEGAWGVERFYAADWKTVRNKSTGEIYAEYYEEIFEF
jgi:hypothetical protein